MEAFSDCQLWWGREENNLQMPVHETRTFKSAWLDKNSWANTALGKSFPCCHEGNVQICSKGSRVIKEDENCVKTVRSFRTWEVFRKRVWNLQVSELIFTQIVKRPWKGWGWLGQHQRRLSRVLKSCPTLLPDILHGCQSPVTSLPLSRNQGGNPWGVQDCREGNREMSEGRPQQGALWKARLRTGGGAAEGTGQKAGKDISATTCLPKDMFPKKSLAVRIKGKIKKV